MYSDWGLSRLEKSYLSKGYFNAALAEYSFRLGFNKTTARVLMEYASKGFLKIFN